MKMSVDKKYKVLNLSQRIVQTLEVPPSLEAVPEVVEDFEIDCKGV